MVERDHRAGREIAEHAVQGLSPVTGPGAGERAQHFADRGQRSPQALAPRAAVVVGPPRLGKDTIAW